MTVTSQYDDSREEIKVCKRCKEPRPLRTFCKCSGSRGGRKHVCNKCRSFENFMRTNPTPEAIEKYKENYKRRENRDPNELRRWKAIRSKYGLSRSQYEKMERQQGHKCAICRTDKPGGRFDVLVVDHCHETGRVRGLLCNACNVALGRFGDTPDAIFKVYEYVLGRAA